MTKQNSARKSLSKKVKSLICLLIIMIVGLFAGLIYMNSLQNTVLAERNRVSEDKDFYLSKISECSGTANTTNSTVNSAGLTDCGGDMAVKSLKLVSLKDIYSSYCREGFGVAIYGCTFPSSSTVYVCYPGTSVYDQKYAYSTWRYIYYRTFSYSCSESQSKNTIRHELLHLVYSKLSSEERSRINKALSSYRNSYESQLSVYSASNRDEELFVRVGADGRYVSDIELVNLYSKVSSTYTAQKQNYYTKLVQTANEDIDKYDGLSTKYTALSVASISVIFISFCVLIRIIVKNHSTNKQKNKVLLTKEEDSERAAREFEYFKKKYGIIDIYE